jgi:uncharacterized membrane protein
MTAAVLITIFTVLLVLFLERLNSTWIKKIFNWLPSILLAYLIPAVCSYILNRDFSEVTIHQWSKDLFIPLAIVAVMSSLSVSQLKKVGWKPIAVFLSGSLWIAIFPVGFLLIFQNTDFVSESLLGLERWKGIPPIVGSWIGGSTSQLVLKELVACPEALFLTILVLDNILVNLWTIGMFQTIKKSDTVNKLLGIQSYEPPSEVNTNQNKSQSPLLSISILLGSVFLAHISLPSFVGKVVALSLLGLGFGFFIKSWNSQFTLLLGSILILLVMAVLGLKLQFDLIQFDIVFMGFFSRLVKQPFFSYARCSKAFKRPCGLGSYCEYGQCRRNCHCSSRYGCLRKKMDATRNHLGSTQYGYGNILGNGYRRSNSIFTPLTLCQKTITSILYY